MTPHQLRHFRIRTETECIHWSCIAWTATRKLPLQTASENKNHKRSTGFVHNLRHEQSRNISVIRLEPTISSGVSCVYMGFWTQHANGKTATTAWQTRNFRHHMLRSCRRTSVGSSWRGVRTGLGLSSMFYIVLQVIGFVLPSVAQAEFCVSMIIFQWGDMIATSRIREDASDRWVNWDCAATLGFFPQNGQWCSLFWRVASDQEEYDEDQCPNFAKESSATNRILIGFPLNDMTTHLTVDILLPTLDTFAILTCLK